MFLKSGAEIKVISTAWKMETDSFHWESSSPFYVHCCETQMSTLVSPYFPFSFLSCSLERTPVINFLFALPSLTFLSFILLLVLSSHISHFPLLHFYCFNCWCSVEYHSIILSPSVSKFNTIHTWNISWEFILTSNIKWNFFSLLSLSHNN